MFYWSFCKNLDNKKRKSQGELFWNIKKSINRPFYLITKIFKMLGTFNVFNNQKKICKFLTPN